MTVSDAYDAALADRAEHMISQAERASLPPVAVVNPVPAGGETAGAFKLCTCCLRVFTLSEWRDLPLLGVQQTETDDGRPSTMDLRNCSCGSTLCGEEEFRCCPRCGDPVETVNALCRACVQEDDEADRGDYLRLVEDDR